MPVAARHLSEKFMELPEFGGQSCRRARPTKDRSAHDCRAGKSEGLPDAAD